MRKLDSVSIVSENEEGPCPLSIISPLISFFPNQSLENKRKLWVNGRWLTKLLKFFFFYECAIFILINIFDFNWKALKDI